MCFGGARAVAPPAAPAPPVLPAAAGPPPPTPRPTPPPDQIRRLTDANAAVKQARTSKDKDPSLTGVGSLRIPLQVPVNTGTATPQGGVNT